MPFRHVSTLLELSHKLPSLTGACSFLYVQKLILHEFETCGTPTQNQQKPCRTSNLRSRPEIDKRNYSLLSYILFKLSCSFSCLFFKDPFPGLGRLLYIQTYPIGKMKWLKHGKKASLKKNMVVWPAGLPQAVRRVGPCPPEASESQPA